MRKIQLITILFLIAFTSKINAQTGFAFSCSRDTTIDGCVTPCITLKAKIPDVRSSTNSYVINPLTGPNGCFNPYVSPATPGSSTSLTQDDTYSGTVTLPFQFPFYDDAASPYNSLIISSNGFVSFDVSKAGAYSHYSMTAGDVPDIAYDKSLIMGVFHDIDPFYTTSPTQQIKYQVLGVSPHRRFVVSYYKVPQFSTTCQNLIENTHQIVLYEGLGIIEVFVFSAEQCPTWNQGRKMIGLHNANKDKGLMAPGRTAEGPNWGARNMNETWRFVPASGPSLFRGVELYDLNGTLIATGDTTGIGSNTLSVSFPNVCPQGNTTYIVRSKYASFNNPNAFIYGADTIRVISNNPLSAAYAASAASCATAGIGTVAIFASGAPGTFEYSADNGVTWQTSNIFNFAPGTYTIKFRIIGTTCIGIKTVVVTADPNLVAGTYNISNVRCNGGSTGSINVTGLNGTGVFQYSLNGGAFQSSGLFSNLVAGTYTVTIRDNSNCVRDTIINVVEPTPLTAQGFTTNATCSATPNGSLNVEAAGGANVYEYSINGGAYQSSPNFTVTNGTYTVSVRDLNGCIKTFSNTVALTNDLSVQTRVDTTICLGGSVELTTTGNAATYSWSGAGLSPNSSIASPIATPTSLGATTYTLLATLGQCTVTKRVVVRTNSQINVNAGQNATIILGESAQLSGTVTGAGTYLWTSSPADNTLSSTTILNPIATPVTTTTYTLTATNVAGCNSTGNVIITVIPYCIKVKNAFTPNGDGINDFWSVYGQFDCLKNVTVTVFNRYGSRIYSSKSYRNDWNGTYNGKPVPDGTYYAVVDFQLISGKKITVKSDVTIIR